MEPAKKTVILIEDSETFRFIYREILNYHGYEVLEAENGKIGWEKIKNVGPDLVLLDIMVPEMDGFEVLRMIRSVEATVDIPVIILTAVEGDACQKGLAAGATDCIIKGSCSPEEVVFRISDLLGIRKS